MAGIDWMAGIGINWMAVIEWLKTNQANARGRLLVLELDRESERLPGRITRYQLNGWARVL